MQQIKRFIYWYLHPQGVFNAPLRQLPRRFAEALLRMLITLGVFGITGILFFAVRFVAKRI